MSLNINKSTDTSYRYKMDKIIISTTGRGGNCHTILNNIDNVYCNGSLFTKWHQDRHSEFCKHHSFNGFLGEFNVGEVRKHNDKNYFFSFSNNIIFSSKNGINDKNYINLLNKISL